VLTFCVDFLELSSRRDISNYAEPFQLLYEGRKNMLRKQAKKVEGAEAVEVGLRFPSQIMTLLTFKRRRTGLASTPGSILFDLRNSSDTGIGKNVLFVCTGR
jgi:hypothetical protein